MKDTKSSFGSHKEIIFGSFVLGTLAFTTAHTWAAFIHSISDQIINDNIARCKKRQKEEIGIGVDVDICKNEGHVIMVKGLTALVFTVISIVVVFLLAHFDLLFHKKQQLPTPTTGFMSFVPSLPK